MSVENKGRLEVQKVVRDCILNGLTQTNHTGWDCMEFGNASMQKADKVVLMQYSSHERVGWQGRRYDDTASGLQRTDEWIEQQEWILHVIHKRTSDGTELAEDIATELIAWFNGPGNEELRKGGIASLPIDAASVIVYNDNSDLYQKRATFTVKLQVPKELTFGQAKLSALEVEDYPV